MPRSNPYGSFFHRMWLTTIADVAYGRASRDQAMDFVVEVNQYTPRWSEMVLLFDQQGLPDKKILTLVRYWTPASDFFMSVDAVVGLLKPTNSQMGIVRSNYESSLFEQRFTSHSRIARPGDWDLYQSVVDRGGEYLEDIRRFWVGEFHLDSAIYLEWRARHWHDGANKLYFNVLYKTEQSLKEKSPLKYYRASEWRGMPKSVVTPGKRWRSTLKKKIESFENKATVWLTASTLFNVIQVHHFVDPEVKHRIMDASRALKGVGSEPYRTNETNIYRMNHDDVSFWARAYIDAQEMT